MSVSTRQFNDADSETVFMLRTRAMVTQFSEELSPEQIAAGINAYLPNDHLRMARTIKYFIAEKSDIAVAFYALKLKEPEIAELLFIYIDTQYLHGGIGSELIRHSENWIRTNWPEVHTYMVDTAIPKYHRPSVNLLLKLLRGKREVSHYPAHQTSWNDFYERTAHRP